MHPPAAVLRWLCYRCNFLRKSCAQSEMPWGAPIADGVRRRLFRSLIVRNAMPNEPSVRFRERCRADGLQERMLELVNWQLKANRWGLKACTPAVEVSLFLAACSVLAKTD